MNVKPLTATQKKLYEIAIDPDQAHKFWKSILILQTFVRHYNVIWLIVCGTMLALGYMLGIKR